MTKPTLSTSTTLLVQIATAAMLCLAVTTQAMMQHWQHHGQASFISPWRLHQHGQPTTTTSLPLMTVDEIPSDTTAEYDTSFPDASYDPESILQSRNRLLALSTTLASNSPTGRFLTRTMDKIKVRRAIEELEAVCSPSSSPSRGKELLLGEWTLIATANVPSSDIRRRFFQPQSKKEDNHDKEKNGWFQTKNGTAKRSKRRSGLSLFGREGRPLNPIEKSLRKSIQVTQRIRSDTTDGSSGKTGEISRVDNVIEYTPPSSFKDIFPEDEGIPFMDLLGGINLNPLEVKKSKVILVHKAEVESVEPVLRTKIAWVSSVLNVAGTSSFFDPEGSDLLGTNNPLGEFLNVGTFDTLYVDEDVRVSRTSGPLLDQLRVFVKKGSSILEDDKERWEALVAEMRVEEEVEVGASDKSDAEKRIERGVGNVRNTLSTLSEAARNVRKAVEKDLDALNTAVGDAVDDVVERVQDAVEGDLEELQEAVRGVQVAMNEFTANGTSIGNSTSAAVVRDALGNVTKALNKVPQDVGSVVEEDMAEIGEAVDEALDKMVKDVQDSVEGDIPKIEKSVGEVRKVVTGEEEKVKKGEDEDEEEEEDVSDETNDEVKS